MRVLFVCTGNTCRSPMAEGLFRRLAQEAGMPAEVKSAGISAMTGAPFAEHTHTVLRERNAKAEGQATAATAELLQWADWVFVMTMGHKQALISQFPEFMDKVYLLKEFVNQDPQVEERQSQLDKLYVEAEMKRAQFLTEYKKEIEQLEQRLHESGNEDPELEQQLEQWQDRLRKLTQEEENMILELQAEMPDFDVADPFGGTLDDYRQCADELEATLHKLIQLLSKQQKGGK